MKAVSFLLGAGVSMPFGTPSGYVLTDELLNPSSLWYQDGSRFSLWHGDINDPFIKYHPSKEKIETISKFSKILISETEKYYKLRGRTASYEDIYGLCYTLQDYKSDKYVTEPLIGRSYKRILCQCRFQRLFNYKIPQLSLVSDFCKLTMSFIKSILSIKLNIKDFSSTGLETLMNFIKNSYYHKINIFTLNHDIIVEKLLQQNSLNYTDGFDTNDYFITDFFLWNPSVYKSDQKINLLKLHGSIDWENFFLCPGQIYYTNSRGKDGLDVYKVKTRDGRELTPSTDPDFLTGSTNKFIYYNFDKFVDSQYWFKELIDESDILIISGYSFGDSGINRRILEWLYKGKQKKVIIIDPSKYETLKEKSVDRLFAHFNNVNCIHKELKLSEINYSSLLRYVYLFEKKFGN